MGSLRFREKGHLEDYLEMGGGYVLNFSDRTFGEFFTDFDIDISSAVYREGHSGSKANRLRAFWEREPDRLIGEVLEELIRYAEAYRPGHPRGDECRAIAGRLKGSDVAGAKAGQVAPRPRVPVAAPVQAGSRPIEIFFSYAHEDEGLMDVVRLQLVVRERLGQIVKWHDRMIPAGDRWKEEIDHRIEDADVILLFMSPHFLASRYCYEIEGDIALRRHGQGTARVIPVVLRACDWTVTPFGEFQALPRDGRPLTQWPDRDQAALEVAQGIMESIGRR